MGKLYEQFKKRMVAGDIERNAPLIYDLAARSSRAGPCYSPRLGNGTFEQFRISPEDSPGWLLTLQVTRFQDGRYSLCMHGFHTIGLPNRISYFRPNEHRIFMEYLEFF